METRGTDQHRERRDGKLRDAVECPLVGEAIRASRLQWYITCKSPSIYRRYGDLASRLCWEYLVCVGENCVIEI